MKKIILPVLLIAMIATACNPDENTPSPTPNPNPNPTTNVKTGTKFTYQRTKFDGQTGTSVVSTTTYTLTMIKDSTINNEKWFIAERKDAASTQYGLMKFATDGIYTFNGQARMEMKFNAAVNDTWTDASDQTCKVLSINQSVTVPKGTYTNAYYVEKNDANSLENKTWYNNSEYLLKNEEYDESPTQSGVMIIDYRDELVSIQF